MKDNFKNTTFKSLVAACFVIMLILLAVHRRGVRLDDYSLDFMGTETHILALARSEKTAQKCIQAAEAELKKVDDVMDYHDPNSQLSNLNRSAFGQSIPVDKNLFDVILSGIEYGKLSGGLFDITIGPLVDLWANAKHRPGDAEIEAAKAKVGYQKLIIDANNNAVGFGVEGMKIDLGGIAKGYAIDMAVEAMQKAGVLGGLIDVGGDIRCFGKSPGDGGFMVGLQNPKAVSDANQQDVLMVFEMGNSSVATSGDYQRFVEIDGQRVSHIIDPATKGGANRYSSVTVIAKKAIDADALATTFSLMDSADAVKLAESIDGVEVLLIDKNSRIIQSSGLGKYKSR